MKLFADKNIKHFFKAAFFILGAFLLLAQVYTWLTFGRFSAGLFLLFLWMAGSLFVISFLCFHKQNSRMEKAVSQINAFLDGDFDARIDCDEEGELCRLFHSVNTLAAVLNAHASNELREKEFLKNTISDISHQLKTPLAALNIYNGILQEEAKENSEIFRFAALSEQELDRIGILVQNLLKITKLDAGSIRFEKRAENLADMMKDVKLHFSWRAEQEKKSLLLSGDQDKLLFCDRSWMLEALDNIVKNALDHTRAGDVVCLEWQALANAIRIRITDSGSGIHPEDLPHIFKRFYRSRFSKDTQGIGLGLPLAKAIVEAHEGTIEVDSELDAGTAFTIFFPIPTKL